MAGSHVTLTLLSPCSTPLVTDVLGPLLLMDIGTPMKTPKDEVRELLDTLPDDASLEDIQYHRYVRRKIEKGLEAAQAGQVISGLRICLPALTTHSTKQLEKVLQNS